MEIFGFLPNKSNKKAPHFCGGLNLRYQKQHQHSVQEYLITITVTSGEESIETQSKSTSVLKVSNCNHPSSTVKITIRGIIASDLLILIIFAICVPDFNEEKLFVNK